MCHQDLSLNKSKADVIISCLLLYLYNHPLVSISVKDIAIQAWLFNLLESNALKLIKPITFYSFCKFFCTSSSTISTSMVGAGALTPNLYTETLSRTSLIVITLLLKSHNQPSFPAFYPKNWTLSLNWSQRWPICTFTLHVLCLSYAVCQYSHFSHFSLFSICNVPDQRTPVESTVSSSETHTPSYSVVYIFITVFYLLTCI